MKRVPKKNIDPNITDVVAPGFRRAEKKEQAKMKPALAAEFASGKYATSRERGSASQSTPRYAPVARFVGAFLVVAALVSGVALFYAYRANRFTITALARSLGDFYSFFGKQEYVETSRRDAGGLQDVILAFKGLGSDYEQFQALSGSAVRLLTELKEFESSWLSNSFAGRGADTIARLERMQAIVGDIRSGTAKLEENSALASRILPVGQETYFETKMDLDRAQAFLGRLIAWLKDDRPHRVAIFLENPSEIRPGGGFLGSYADVTIAKGAIAGMQVYDINDADRLFDRKIVPPLPLQAIVRRWRAADANWFFDFGESASTTLGFLESSGLYGPTHTRFEAAVGVSARAVGDILAVTGPVTLKGGTALDTGNFLKTLQRSVQKGQADSASYPKAAIQDFAPLLLDKLVSLPADPRAALFEKAKQWFAARDVRLFARDQIFEGFFKEYGLAGDMFQIPEQFQGDYLAVVQANIGGGKSDLYVKQKINLESQILEEGAVQNRITIARTHTAPAGDPSWYTQANRVFTRLFAPPSASLTYAQGGSAKVIAPRAEYAAGYETDPRIAAVEASVAEHPEYPAIASFRDLGKAVFGTWVSTKRGETSELTLSYTTQLPARIETGGAYEFVFDRQSGVEGEYHFELHAPVGYVFKENNLPVYEYVSSDPPGRLTIHLTFERIQ